MAKKNKIAAEADSLVPVSDAACERMVIGTLLQNDRAYGENSDILTEDCFTDYHLRMVFRAICSLQAMGEEADMLTIPPYIERTEGKAFPLSDFLDLTHGYITAGLREKCLYLTELARRRKLFLIAKKLEVVGSSLSVPIDETLNDLSNSINDISGGEGTVMAFDGALSVLSDVIDENKNGGVQFDSCGIACFDGRAFLRPEALTVIAAYSGHGKSCLASTIAFNCAKNGASVAYYSLEMSKVELAARMLSHVCDVPASKLLYGQLKGKEKTSFDKARLETSELPVFFDERATISTDTLYMSIQRMARKEHVHGVIIDYLQILSQTNRPAGMTEEAFLGGVVRRLKNLAKQLGIWIILISQLSRNHSGERPDVSYLRGSGQILEACDNCALLYRPERVEGGKYYGENASVTTEGTAEITISKARNGRDGQKYIINFDAEHTWFSEKH